MMCINQIPGRSRAFDALPTDIQLYECGKCEACLKKHKNDVIYRIECELRTYPSALFMTYTYDPAHLPFYDTKYQFSEKETRMNTHKCYIRWQELVSKKLDWDGSFVMSLMPTDVRLMCRKFRENGIRYYVCGEYGDDDFGSHRPHYHAIILSDMSMTDLQLFAESPKLWSFGYTKALPVIPERVEYVCKDMLKQEELPTDERATPNFHRWSNGLGMHGFINDMQYISKDPLKRFVWLNNGQKARVPRYFKEIFFKNEIYNRFLQQKYDAESRRREQAQIENYSVSFRATTGEQDSEKALRNYYSDYDVRERQFNRLAVRKSRKGR